MAAPRPFRPADLLRQVRIDELTLSPDGAEVVYAKRTIEDGEYRKRLWRVPYAGGRPEQLTAGPVDAHPRFSPDGRTLLFLSKRSGRMQPWVLPTGGGEPSQLTELPGDVSAGEWSPDGGTVVLLAPSGEERFLVGDRDSPVARRLTDLTWRLDGVGVRDMFSSLWTTPARGGRPKRLTGAHEVGDPFWSSDSKRIGFLADLRAEASVAEWPQAWSVAADGGRPRALAELPGFVLAARWSSGGRLALLGSETRTVFTQLDPYVLERDGPRRLAADLDRPCAFLVSGDLLDSAARLPPPLHWIDEEALVALVTVGGACIPHRFGLDGRAERLIQADAVCARLALAAGRMVVTACTDAQPSEVYAVEDGDLRRLTREGGRWLAPHHREAERVVVRHRERHELEAWLLRPPRQRRKRPLVLQIHGGPHLAHGPTPWLEMLALAGAGIGVLWGNPRGSVGYGEAFASAIEGNWGEADSSDLLRLVDWAVAEGHADPDRIGLLGLSYGGYMTAWLLGRYPGRFAAGVCQNPVADAASFYGESDYGFLGPKSIAGVDAPWSDPERVRDRSPIARIHRNEAPLLLLQAEDDLRCPPGQTDLLFTTLRCLDRPVEMVRYPQESHLMGAIGRPDRRVDRLERIVDWFERHLLERK